VRPPFLIFATTHSNSASAAEVTPFHPTISFSQPVVERGLYQSSEKVAIIAQYSIFGSML